MPKLKDVESGANVSVSGTSKPGCGAVGLSGLEDERDCLRHSKL